MRKLSTILLVFLLLCVALPFLPTIKAQEEHGSFGNPTLPEVTSLNWTRFWQLFNVHSDWDLEYNNGSGWISSKQSLQVIRNYYANSTEMPIPANVADASFCKISLNFTSPYTANYRLTFAIDLDVKEYIYYETKWEYVVSYQNYTVFFNWADLKNVSGLIFSHGIQPIEDESWFWFRIRRDNVPANYNILLDPSFGYPTPGGSFSDTSANQLKGSHWTMPEDGTADNITFYGKGTTSMNVKAAIYLDSDKSLVAETGTVAVTTTNSWWTTPDFASKPDLTEGTEYWLVLMPDTSSFRIYYQSSSSGKGGYDQEGEFVFPNPCSLSYEAREFSLFCNYTVAAGGETYNVGPSITLDFALSSLTIPYLFYQRFSAITLNFALASTVSHTAAALWKIFPSVTLDFSLASALNHITAVWNLHPSITLNFALASAATPFYTFVKSHGINLVFALASTATPFYTYVQSHGISLVFALASTAQQISEGIRHVSSGINLNFALASAQAFYGHYIVTPGMSLVFVLASQLGFINPIMNVTPGIALTFAISSVSDFIGIFNVGPSVTLTFALSSLTHVVEGIIYKVFPKITVVWSIVTNFLPVTPEVSVASAGFAIIAIALALCALAIGVKALKRERTNKYMEYV